MYGTGSASSLTARAWNNASHALRAAGHYDESAHALRESIRIYGLKNDPNGLDAGELVPIPPFFTVAEAVVNYLNAVGIRVKMRPMERAAFYAAWREKKLRGLFITAAGNSGNAASRVEGFIYSKGGYAYGGYPDIDDLFMQQASERDPRKREAVLHRIQQLTIDRAMFAPITDLRALMGVGPRVTEHTITWIHNSPFPSYEDMRLKSQ